MGISTTVQVCWEPDGILFPIVSFSQTSYYRVLNSTALLDLFTNLCYAVEYCILECMQWYFSVKQRVLDLMQIIGTASTILSICLPQDLYSSLSLSLRPLLSPGSDSLSHRRLHWRSRVPRRRLLIALVERRYGARISEQMDDPGSACSAKCL